MRTIRFFANCWWLTAAGLTVAGILAIGMTSCRSSYQPERRTEPYVGPGWPKGDNFFTQVSYAPAVGAKIPEIPGAEYVKDDELCAQCHETYTKTMAHNVHGGFQCEACHGPASRHLETRGKEEGLIFNPKEMDPVVASELCLRCHETDACSVGGSWRTSVHAAKCVSCQDCHSVHYNVPPGAPKVVVAGMQMHQPVDGYVMASDQRAPLPGQPVQAVRYQQNGNGGSGDPATAPLNLREGWQSLRGTSHNLAAEAPYVCYKCHADYRQYQEIAGPHQIGGANGFNCTTCHDPHGRIVEYSRVDLCLQCHNNNSPALAWHSSLHSLHGVGCTDCHNPHPNACVPRVALINHTDIERANRRPMNVQEPEVCYKCHQDIYGLTTMPSHHPIKEGKMVCSDCHDSHGQYEKNLKEETVNLVCWKCHAEFQGPFAYEHPPVTENCAYCHEPHGAVEEDLLRQPVTFLCLRCHSGHRNGPAGPNHLTTGWLPDFVSTNAADPRTAINRFGPQGRRDIQAAFYQKCTVCHSQIHGSDVPTPHLPGALMR